jgi:DNA-binding CsgD family transcriptional regulator
MSTRTDPGRALSPRELEIANLVATSLTNGQIAGRLEISARTVEAHLRNVYAKISVANRTQLCTWLWGDVG